MPEIELALSCTDFQGHKVIFRKDSYDSHCNKHPELEDITFFPSKVKEAIQKPTLYISGHRNNATCYYLELYAINGIIKYVKVVVSNKTELINQQKVYRIKTAFKTDHIQEKKYGYDVHYLEGALAL